MSLLNIGQGKGSKTKKEITNIDRRIATGEGGATATEGGKVRITPDGAFKVAGRASERAIEAAENLAQIAHGTANDSVETVANASTDAAAQVTDIATTKLTGGMTKFVGWAAVGLIGYALVQRLGGSS